MAKDVESPGRYHLSDALRADKSKADPPPTAEEWRDSVTERLERLHEQVNEIHTVRKLVAWAVPTIITGTLTFIVTAFVAFYRLQALSTDFDLHAAAPATVAHPGTAESLWEVKRDVAAMQSTALSMQRELGLRDEETRERLQLIQAQVDRIAESVSVLTARRQSGRP